MTWIEGKKEVPIDITLPLLGVMRTWMIMMVAGRYYTKFGVSSIYIQFTQGYIYMLFNLFTIRGCSTDRAALVTNGALRL